MIAPDFPRHTLAAGTVLHHGSRCAGDYQIPDGPAWFAQAKDRAIYFIDWSSTPPTGRTFGDRRLFTYEILRDVELLDTRRLEDWSRLCREVADGDEEAGIYRVALELADQQQVGWLGTTEVMFCAPERHLRFVGVAVMPEPPARVG